jgi:hypothetical protein
VIHSRIQTLAGEDAKIVFAIKISELLNARIARK